MTTHFPWRRSSVSNTFLSGRTDLHAVRVFMHTSNFTMNGYALGNVRHKKINSVLNTGVIVRPSLHGHVLFSGPCTGVRMEFHEADFVRFHQNAYTSYKCHFRTLKSQNTIRKYRFSIIIQKVSVTIYFQYSKYEGFLWHVFITKVLSRKVT